MSKKLYFKNQNEVHFQMNKTENLLLVDPPYKKILKEALQAKSKWPPHSNLNTHIYTQKYTSKGFYVVIKDSINAHFFSTD